MRASRLVSVLLLLQSRGRMTAQQLADELEVSVRTIYRDVGSLHAAGVPLYGDAGPDGGYQLLAGYRTRLTGLTAAEAESLFLTGLPGPAADLGLGTVAAAARLKVLAALPDELRDRAGRISSRFHLDAPGWYHEGEENPFLAAVADAVWGDKVLQVRYRRWRAPEEVTRTLWPYGLVLKAGRWYLVAGSDPDRVATYRVSQILDLQSTGDSFQRPAGFDLAGYWLSYLDDFDRRRHRAQAVVRLSPHGRERLAHLMGSIVARAADASAARDRRKGWIRATIPIESLEHAAGELLRLGADVEVLAPPELRERLADTARRLAATYRTGDR
jgi:predicted DNA-binding transcriptional regulator YafY